MVYDGGYGLAAVCESGHTYSSSLEGHLAELAKFCNRCGAPILTACPSCGTALRGYYHVPMVVSARKYQPPSFCFSCGQPMPWTASRLEAARELAAEMEELSEEDREVLTDTFDDLARDTPKTQLAATRYRRITAKLGKSAAEALREILVDIASETARKAMGI